jgi:hypothetical protein
MFATASGSLECCPASASREFKRSSSLALISFLTHGERRQAGTSADTAGCHAGHSERLRGALVSFWTGMTSDITDYSQHSTILEELQRVASSQAMH